jgi:hypothetical protein
MSPKCERCGKQNITSIKTYFVYEGSTLVETLQLKLCQDCKDSFVRYLAKI